MHSTQGAIRPSAKSETDGTTVGHINIEVSEKYGKRIAYCRRCYHEWMPRVEQPSVCPRCGTRRLTTTAPRKPQSKHAYRRPVYRIHRDVPSTAPAIPQTRRRKRSKRLKHGGIIPMPAAPNKIIDGNKPRGE